MIVPKLSRYYVEEFYHRELCGYGELSKGHYSPEEAVEAYLREKQPITASNNYKINFSVKEIKEDFTEGTEHYVQATYGWSCKKFVNQRRR